MADFTVNILLKARDEAGQAIDGLIGKGDQLGKTLGGRGGLGGNNFRRAADGINQLAGLSRQAVLPPLELASNYEAALNRVNAFSGGALGASGNLEKIGARARELGASTEFTATQAVDAFAVMTQAGFTYEEQMASISTVMDLATAGGIDLAKSAGIVGSSLGGFGKDAKEAADIADVMAKTASLTQTDIAALGQTFKVVAPVSKDLGISVRDTAAAIGVLGKSGIKGGEAGTALRSIFGKLAAPTTGNQKKVLKALGISKDAMRKAIESGDLASPLVLLNEAMEKKGVTGARRTTALKAFFGERRFAQASLLIDSVGASAQGSNKSLQFFQETLKDTDGSLDTMAKTMRTGTQASMKELKSSMEELGITAGEELLPVVKPLIEDAIVATREFAAWAKEHPELVKNLGKLLLGVVALGAVIGPVTTLVSGLSNVMSLGTGAAQLFGKKGMLDAANGMAQFIGTSSKFNPAVATMIGSKAGFAGMLGAAAAAGAVGFAFGTWLDETFGISDAIAGLNTELSIHNQLVAEGISLQIGRSKFRGSAKLGDLSEEERAQLEAAQAKKEKLSGELGEFQGSGSDFLNQLTFGLTADRDSEDITADIQKQQAIIDKINQEGLKRQAERQAGVGGGAQAPTLGAGGREAAAAAKELDNLTTGVPIDAGGEIRIVVEDGRVKTGDIKSGDIPISVESGISLEGG